MQTKVQIYQPKDQEQQLPIELINMRTMALNNVTIDMRLFGIAKININYKVIGLKGITNISFQPLSAEPPETLADCREWMIRHLAEYMLQFGVLSIEILPTPEELEIIKASWVQLSTAQPEASPKDNIKLNIEEDPTMKNSSAEDNIGESK